MLLYISCEKLDDTAIDPATLDKWVSYTTSNGLADNRIWAIMTDSEGSVWFGTDNGVSRYNGSKWTTYRTNDGLINNSVYAIEQDVFGDIWIGTAQGFSIYDGNSFENWDLVSMHGASIVSGVYMFVVEDEGGDTKVGKFVVMR